jgi:hypothetical protein
VNDRELDDLLRAAPRGADLPADPWPGIEDGIGRRAPGYRPALTAAAGVLLFAAGLASGAALFGGPGDDAPSPLPRPSAFETAARVQAAGSAYLAAVGELDRLRLEAAAGDAVAVAQGYEAALAVAAAFTGTLGDAPGGGPATDELDAAMSRARESMGERVAELIRRRGAP